MKKGTLYRFSKTCLPPRSLGLTMFLSATKTSGTIFLSQRACLELHPYRPHLSPVPSTL
jgi:hypothetical protein